jgi:hypothetical protein
MDVGTGAPILVTQAPYSAMPADVSAVLEPSKRADGIRVPGLKAPQNRTGQNRIGQNQADCVIDIFYTSYMY